MGFSPAPLPFLFIYIHTHAERGGKSSNTGQVVLSMNSFQSWSHRDGLWCGLHPVMLQGLAAAVQPSRIAGMGKLRQEALGWNEAQMSPWCGNQPAGIGFGCWGIVGTAEGAVTLPPPLGEPVSLRAGWGPSFSPLDTSLILPN